jgi:hypothetical protein
MLAPHQTSVPIPRKRRCVVLTPSNHWIEAMKNVIEHIARALVDNPEMIEVSETASNQISVLALKVAKEDLLVNHRVAGEDKETSFKK